MSRMQEKVRPRAEYLANLSTLEVMASEDVAHAIADLAPPDGIDWRAELKLRRDGFAYWLITKGTEGEGPEFLRRGYVLMKGTEPDEQDQCHISSYGPDNIDWLQGFDYYNALLEDRNRLEEEQEWEFTNDRAKQIEATRSEMKTVEKHLQRK